MKKALITSILLLATNLYAQNDTLRFAIAGHGYGAHTGANIGLHQPFLDAIDRVPNRHEFLVLTGDIVRNSVTSSWNAVESELSTRNITSYYVRGNHDKGIPADTAFSKKHGGDFYYFKKDSVLFIALNSGQNSAKVSQEQIDFLNNTLQTEAPHVSHILIMFHFLLWNGEIRYKDISSNLGSQYSYLGSTANYWDDIHPILNGYSDKKIFVVAGDLGGRSYSIPAYYEQLGHISLVASGMGEINDENYLEWTFIHGNMNIDVIPLNENLPVKPIDDYQYYISTDIEHLSLETTVEIIQKEGGLFILTDSPTLVSIYNLNGQQVIFKQIDYQTFISTNMLASGTYLVKTSQGSMHGLKKVFVP